MVVIAIMGLLVGLVPVAYGKVRESTQYRSLLRTITADMRRARQNAQAVGQPQTFMADLKGRKVGLQGQTLQDVPQPLQIKATVGNEQLQEGVASIVFLPSGGATGGSIEIIRPNNEGTRLRVDWLSGQVTQERLLP
jgi:general secretion pathway protein H